MKTFLEQYLARIQQSPLHISSETGHEISSALLSFKYGLYQNASRNASAALSDLPGDGPHVTIHKALAMVRERSDKLEASDPTPALSTIFDENDTAWLCITLPDDPGDPVLLAMDNALLLLYAVGLATSPEDQQALEENQKFALQIISEYKKPLAL